MFAQLFAFGRTGLPARLAGLPALVAPMQTRRAIADRCAGSKPDLAQICPVRWRATDGIAYRSIDCAIEIRTFRTKRIVAVRA